MSHKDINIFKQLNLIPKGFCNDIRTHAFSYFIFDMIWYTHENNGILYFRKDFKYIFV